MDAPAPAPPWYCNEQAGLLARINKFMPLDPRDVADALSCHPVDASKVRVERIVVVIDPPREHAAEDCTMVALYYTDNHYYVVVGLHCAHHYATPSRESSVMTFLQRVRAVPGLRDVPMSIAFLYERGIDTASMRAVISAYLPDVQFEPDVTTMTSEYGNPGRGSAINVYEVARMIICRNHTLLFDDKLVSAGDYDAVAVIAKRHLVNELLGRQPSFGDGTYLRAHQYNLLHATMLRARARRARRTVNAHNLTPRHHARRASALKDALLFTYMCTRDDADLCVGMSTRGDVATERLPAVLKSASRNQNKYGRKSGLPMDVVKMRWDVSASNDTLLYDANKRMCLKASAATREVFLGKCDDTSQSRWSIAAAGVDARVRHVGSKMCLAVARCDRRKNVARGTTYCDQTPDAIRVAVPPFVAGSPLRVVKCDAAQVWTRVVDCAARCSPYMIGDGKCDLRCYNSACAWDGGDCAPTITPLPTNAPTVARLTNSPTSFTASPTATPTAATTILTPTASPSSPTFQLAPTLAPYQTTLAPTHAPSSVPTVAQNSDAPTTPPTTTTTTTTTKTTSAPYDVDDFTTRPSTAPTFLAPSDNASSSSSVAVTFWWLVLLIIPIAMCVIAVGVHYVRKKRAAATTTTTTTTAPPPPRDSPRQTVREHSSDA